MLGKLKHSLKERCPRCNKILEVRVRSSDAIREGESVTIEKEYICCSNRSCDYEAPNKKVKRVRRTEEY